MEEPSWTEQLIVWMLSDIGKKVGEFPKDHAFIANAFSTGNFWAVREHFPGMFADPIPTGIVREVIDYLDMWRSIEEASNEKFPGFDAKDETSYVSVARILTEEMGRFNCFKGRVNHGKHQLSRYRAMYSVFKMIRKDLAERGLSKSEVRKIMAAHS